MTTLQLVSDSILDLIDSSSPYEFGSEPFYLLLAVAFFSWVLVARVMMALFKSERGLVSALFALLFPLLLGLSAYGLAETQVVPEVDRAWARTYLPTIAMAVVAIGVILVISKRLLGLNWVTNLIAVSFASTAAIFLSYGTMAMLDTVEQSGEQFQERNARNFEPIRSDDP